LRDFYGKFWLNFYVAAVTTGFHEEPVRVSARAHGL